MKREKKTPVKVKSRKSSSSSSDSSEESLNESKVIQKRQQQDTSRVLVEECNTNEKQSNVTIKMQNADSLAKYRNMNPHAKIENPKTTTNFTADDISDDDEIWICDIPSSIDVNKLVGESIKLGSKKSTIKTDDFDIQCSSSKYESSNGIYENALSVIFQNDDGQFTMKNIKPVGRMMFHQKVTKSEETLELTPSGRHECTVFPDNLVVRHPLLGRNFEDKIKVSKAIQKSLDEAKIASNEVAESSVRIKQEKEEGSTRSQTTPKKSKKRKAEPIEDPVSTKKRKDEIKIENAQDDDLDRIMQIFGNNN
ncbi:uncharacterized protein LOC116337551 [Contarinia nasturtii]|uniref:uncharacterized protein LOC116337551 n=1 Tax=Contarinia nasturtii TaxID=265458 RepID=UPI0012D3E36D|nr:uncharacterized protein LOC116337551 [Contarinia nasturtii]